VQRREELSGKTARISDSEIQRSPKINKKKEGLKALGISRMTGQ